MRVVGIGHPMVRGLVLARLAAGGDHVVADEVGVSFEIAAQLVIERIDVPDVDDSGVAICTASGNHAVSAAFATIRAHDGPTSPQTLSMIDSRETFSSSTDAA